MFYLTKDYLPVFVPLGFIGIYRWFWYIVKLLAFCLYKPIQPRRRSRFIANRDVTILVPTIDSSVEIKTATESEEGVGSVAREVDPGGEVVKVITIAKPNKRNQMTAGINHVKTEITVFCDDDVIWPDTMLKYMLAPFEDRNMGEWPSRDSYWQKNDHMGDIGIIPTFGRTAAYRTSILRDPHFQWEFTHEFWVGKYHQHSGDDKFLTRWMHSHGWKTYIQCCPEAELRSTFKDNWRFLKQLLRWTRNTWRSDIKSLFRERHVWKRHPFVAFSMLDKFFNPLTLLAGPITVAYLSTLKDGSLPIWIIVISYLTWLIITRLIKYAPHFVKRPQDVFCIPVWLVFNLVFAVMKVYCLFTLYVTDWGRGWPRWMDNDVVVMEKAEEEEVYEEDDGFSDEGSLDGERIATEPVMRRPSLLSLIRRTRDSQATPPSSNRSSLAPGTPLRRFDGSLTASPSAASLLQSSPALSTAPTRHLPSLTRSLTLPMRSESPPTSHPTSLHNVDGVNIGTPMVQRAATVLSYASAPAPTSMPTASPTKSTLIHIEETEFRPKRLPSSPQVRHHPPPLNEPRIIKSAMRKPSVEASESGFLQSLGGSGYEGVGKRVVLVPPEPVRSKMEELAAKFDSLERYSGRGREKVDVVVEEVGREEKRREEKRRGG
ncbi:hypothetical protein BC829DRAFT_445296 [Chytridium lagenaria]|nr:hypothetical protein BC829DRAFT_445296 [Chytridium lagenaria]